MSTGTMTKFSAGLVGFALGLLAGVLFGSGVQDVKHEKHCADTCTKYFEGPKRAECYLLCDTGELP